MQYNVLINSQHLKDADYVEPAPKKAAKKRVRSKAANKAAKQEES